MFSYSSSYIASSFLTARPTFLSSSARMRNAFKTETEHLVLSAHNQYSIEWLVWPTFFCKVDHKCLLVSLPYVPTLEEFQNKLIISLFVFLFFFQPGRVATLVKEDEVTPFELFYICLRCKKKSPSSRQDTKNKPRLVNNRPTELNICIDKNNCWPRLQQPLEARLYLETVCKINNNEWKKLIFLRVDNNEIYWFSFTQAITWGLAFELVGESALKYLNERECTKGGYETFITTFSPRNGVMAPFPVLVFRATEHNSQWLGPAPLDDVAAQVGLDAFIPFLKCLSYHGVKIQCV